MSGWGGETDGRQFRDSVTRKFTPQGTQLPISHGAPIVFFLCYPTPPNHSTRRCSSRARWSPLTSSPRSEESRKMIPAQQHRGRGSLNDLHRAAFHGMTERTIALLSSGSINVDQGDPKGVTPLMFSAQEGQLHVARILLDRGANVSITDQGGFSALRSSAEYGHLAVTLQMVKAGADLELRASTGATPLHLTAQNGHPEIASALIEAGADVDCLPKGKHR